MKSGSIAGVGLPSPIPPLRVGRFGFDSRRVDRDNRGYPDGVAAGALCHLTVHPGVVSECRARTLTVTAFLAAGLSIHEPATRVPVKLADVTWAGMSVHHHGSGQGILVGVPPTIADLEEADGDPYRKEAHVIEDERPKWEAIFRSVTALDVSDWTRPFTAVNPVVLWFENISNSMIHIFGHLEGDIPHDAGFTDHLDQ